MGPNEFDSSDEEAAEGELTDYDVSWLSLESVHYAAAVGISPLPGCKFKTIRRNLLQNIGCKFKTIRRNLLQNIEEIRGLGVRDVFVFCTLAELRKYRVPTLLQEYRKRDLAVHHYPFLDGDVPQYDACRTILDDLRGCLDNDRRTLIHCYGGLGRSCLIAASLLMHVSDAMTPQEAIGLVQACRGPGAIQTVKQYNFVNEFRENVSSRPPKADESDRALSR